MADLDEQLWEACEGEDWAVAAFLLEAGAGTEWRDGPDDYDGGTTAIMQAAAYGEIETIKLLFNRGANIQAISLTGWNALMYASLRDKNDVVSFLADNGTDIHVRGNDGHDALLIAALWGCIDAALELIARQADARVVDNENRTALTYFGIHSYNLSAVQKQEEHARLIAAWLAGPHPSQVAERHWQRRKNAMLFLVGSKFRPMQRDAAAAKLAQEQVDKHAKLSGIPRRSKEENLAYLHKEVFGHEGIQRCLVGML